MLGTLPPVLSYAVGMLLIMNSFHLVLATPTVQLLGALLS